MKQQGCMMFHTVLLPTDWMAVLLVRSYAQIRTDWPILKRKYIEDLFGSVELG